MMNSLHYAEFGNPDKPTLLFLHGFMGSIEDWLEIIELLGNDFRMIAIDLPGHGKSDVGLEQYEFINCANAINTIIKELSLNDVTMIGYSMGGRLALYLGLYHGERLKNLILESTSPGLKTEKEREARRQIDSQRATELETGSMVWFLDDWYRQPLFDSIQTDRKRFELLMQRRLKNSGENLARSLRGMGLGSQPSLWDQLPELSVAGHLIVGEKDRKFTLIAKSMKTKNENLEVIEISKTGHNVHFENPKKQAEIIRMIENS